MVQEKTLGGLEGYTSLVYPHVTFINYKTVIKSVKNKDTPVFLAKVFLWKPEEPPAGILQSHF